MLRTVLIGAGDIKFHYFELLKISEEKFYEEVEKIGKTLAESGCEIVLLPDRGICVEVAKFYKLNGGKKVIGLVPFSDKDFGIDHLKPYMEAKVNGKKIFDEFINTENWFKTNMATCLFGDVILMLGLSPGVMLEFAFGYYLYKLFIGEKPEVKLKIKKIHEEVRAGEKVPFTLLIYEPFMKSKLNEELERYIKKFRGEIRYVKNSEELGKELKILESKL